jgi:hypothetical protein
MSRQLAGAPTSGQRANSNRRAVLGTGLALAGSIVLSDTAFGVRPAQADPTKVSQKAAGYRTSPNGASRCQQCLHFLPPSACKLVDGQISPNGFCSFFAAAR